MTSISSLTPLASFNQAHASSSKGRQTHIALNSVHGAATPLAVAAVQGDGVWTYDLITLRPTASFTVPPSTIFASPPLSFLPPIHRPPTSKEKGKGRVDHHEDVQATPIDPSLRITTVAISQGEKVRKGEEGRVLWVWRGDEGAEKETLLLESPIKKLVYVPFSRAAVLCIHSNGAMTAIDTNLQIRPVHLISPLQVKGVLMNAEVTHVGGNNVNVAMVSSRGSVIVLQLDLSGGRDIQAKVVKEGSLGLGKKKKDLRTAEVDSRSGVVGIAHDGSITAYSLDVVSSTTDALPTLANAPKDAVILPLPSIGLPIAILANASCDLLLCSVSSTLPAVLNIAHLSEVSPTANAHVSDLSLLHQSAGLYTIGVVLTHRDDDGGRSVIYTLEVNIPETGLGINALLGTEIQTKKHLVVPEQSINTVNGTSSIATSLEELLACGAVTEAEEGFDTWMQEAEQRRKQSKVKTPVLTPDEVKRIVVAVLSTAAKPLDVEMLDGDEVQAGVLDNSPSKKPFTGPYAAGLMQRLIKTRLVKNEMWPGGVVEAGLLLASDPEAVQLALKRIPSLPSFAIVSILGYAYNRRHSAAEGAEDGFPTIVAEILVLPPPAPDYRTSLLSLSIEACCAMLEAYLSWLDEHASHVPSSLDKWLSPDLSANQDAKTPTLESIILHSNLLLDARLQSLLSHKPAWEILEKMQAALAPLMEAQENYRKLRAPIDAVLTLSKREAKRRSEEEAKRKVLTAGPGVGHQKGQQDRKGRNRRYGAGMDEEAVGKWRVEDLVF